MNSPATPSPARPAYRRRVHYVDSTIQRSLLLAMVVLEVTLVAASTWLAHWRLIELIDQSMYRMQVAQTGPSLMRFAGEGFAVFGLFALVNVIALAVAAGIWSYHENRVLQAFTKLIGKTRELDFSSDAETDQRREVLALAVAWRARERNRFTAIRQQVAKLEADVLANESPQDMRVALQNLNKLLS